MTKAQLQHRIIRRLTRMETELCQMITDKESWNDNRTDAEPFDVGWEKVLLQCVSNELKCWHAGDIEGVRHWGQKMAEIIDRNDK